MKQLRIIYHSQSAHAESMARALSEHSPALCEELGLSMASGAAMGIF